MDKGYRQLTLKERKEIEDGLNRGDSFRAIARLIGRSPSTVSREVRENRHVRAFRPRKGACRDRSWCKRVGVCAECVREGAFCAGCDVRDCRDFCPAYAERTACDALTRAPWVCNGCRKNRYGCNRGNRFAYEAQVAQRASDERQSRLAPGASTWSPGGPRRRSRTSRTGSGEGCRPTRSRCSTRTSSACTAPRSTAGWMRGTAASPTWSSSARWDSGPGRGRRPADPPPTRPSAATASS